MKVHIILLFLLSRFLVPLAGQSKSEVLELKLDKLSDEHSTYIDSVRSYTSEYDFVFSNLFIFYKKFVSAHDASSCGFTPSCSEYAVMAVKKQGVIIGLINFWDRFARCNGSSPEMYIKDKEKNLLIDPVRNWKHEEL